MVSKRPLVIVRGIGCFSVSVTLSPQSSSRQRKPFTNERKKIMESRKNKPKIRVAQCYSRAERSLRVRPDHEILRILQNRGTGEDEDNWSQGNEEVEVTWNQIFEDPNLVNWENEDNWNQVIWGDEDNWNQRIEEYPNLENWADEDLWDQEALEIGLMKPLREGDSIDLVGFMDDDWDEFLSAFSASVEGGDSPDEDEDEYLTAPSDFEEDIGSDEDEGGIFERLRLTLIRKIREVVGLLWAP